MDKKIIAGLLLALCLGVVIANSGACVNNGVKPLEQMSDLEYSKWKLYIQLGVKIGANRLLQEQTVTHEQLEVAANVIESIKGKPLSNGAKSLILPALKEAGFNNDEVEFILLVAEQELLARGALDWLNPQTGVLELSPRTKEILDIIAASLRNAGTATENEKSEAADMKANFCRSK